MIKTTVHSKIATPIDLAVIAQNICRLADIARDEHLRSINRSQANALLARFSPHARITSNDLLDQRRIAS